MSGFLTLFELEDDQPDPNEYAGRISTMNTKPTMSVQYTHVLKPNLLNTLRFGRYHSVVFRGQEKSADYNITAEDFGLRNVEPEPIAYGPPVWQSAATRGPAYGLGSRREPLMGTISSPNR